MRPEFMRAFNAHWPAVFPVRLLIAVTAIWLCAGLASILLQSSSAALKHRLWAVSIAAALLMPLLVLILPEWRLGIIRSEPQVQIVADAQRSAPAPVVASHIEAAAAEESDRVPVNRSLHAASIEAEPRNPSPIQAAPPLVSAQPPEHKIAPTTVDLGHSFSLSWLILLAWAIPAIWLGVRMILSRRAVSHLIRQTLPVNDRWRTAFARLCEKHGTAQPLLRVNELALTPLCLGIFRPTILIPVGCADWDDMRITAVLTHELAHVVRRDVLWQTLAQLSCALYWLHPLTWVAQWRMRIEREIVCDDWVVASSQPAIPYAQWLLDLATALNAQPGHRRITSAGVAMGNDANLEHRVRAILDARRRRAPLSRRLSIAVGMVTVIAIVLFGALSPFTAHNAKASESPIPDKHPATAPAAVGSGMYRLFGRVTDETGKPMADVPLTILTAGHPASSLRSGTDGTFEFVRESMRFNYDIVLASSADGKLLAFVPAAQGDGENDKPSHEVKVVLKPARQFAVSVRDKSGAGVSGAWVGACSAYKTVGHVVTDAQGNGTLLVPADATLMHVIAMKEGAGFDYQLFWKKDEHRTDPYRLEPDYKGPFNFTLNAVKKVTVVVVDDDQKPLRGVKVDPWLYLLPGKGSEINLSGVEEVQKTSDAEGKATFDVPVDLQRGTNFWTRLDGYCAPQRAIYDPKNPVTEIHTQLLKLIPLHGYVRDAEGKAVPDAKVHINGVGYQMDEFRTDLTTDAAGAFQANVNPELYYGFGADKDVRAAPLQFAIIHRKAPDKPIELKLEKTMPVRLKVTTGPDNTPAPNASIAFYEREDGSYYKLPKEEQFPGETIGRRYISPMITQSLKTDANGMLTVHALVPGDFSFYVYINGQQPAVHFKIKDWQTYSLTEYTRPGRREEKPFDVANPEQGFQVELHADAAAVANRMLNGHVVMRDNPTMSVPDIKVSFRSVGDLFPRDDSVSNKRGDFIIRQDKALQYLFGTSLDGKLRGIATAKPENTSVTLMVGPTASMHGRLIDSDGHPLVGKTIEWGFEVKQLFGTFSTNFGGNAVTDSKGLFHFDGVVPGYEYKLSVVTKFGDHGEPMGWRPVATKTAPTAEDVDLRDVTLPAEREYKPKTPDDYATESFGKPGTIAERLKNAQEIARFSYQQVLVVLGSPGRPAAKKFFEFRHDRENSDAWAALADYALVSANVDDPKNGAKAWAAQFNIDCKANRVVFVILDVNGHYVTHVGDAELSAGDQLSRSKLIAFAKQHTLAKPDAKQILADGLARAKAEDKRVLVEESGPYCSWCVKLGKYFEAHRDQLDKDYVIVTLDYRFTHGEDVISRLKTTEGGIPWMAILDDTGKMLITSDDPKTGNIGYPGEANGRTHWEKMLRTTSRHMTDADIHALLDSLK